MNIVEQLVKGSDELDRMGEEIIRVLTVLCSFAPIGDCPRKEVVFETTPTTRWGFTGRLREAEPEITFSYENISVQCLIVLDAISKYRKPPRYMHVQRMHDDLPNFVELFLIRYPNVRKGIKPILEAGKIEA